MSETFAISFLRFFTRKLSTFHRLINKKSNKNQEPTKTINQTNFLQPHVLGVDDVFVERQIRNTLFQRFHSFQILMQFVISAKPILRFKTIVFSFFLNSAAKSRYTSATIMCCSPFAKYFDRISIALEKHSIAFSAIPSFSEYAAPKCVNARASSRGCKRREEHQKINLCKKNTFNTSVFCLQSLPME
jgi:hypothetical protein